MVAIVTNTLKKLMMQQIIDDIDDSAGARYYIGIGRSQDWNDLDSAVDPLNSEREERNFRLNMQSMKRVANYSFTVPRRNWSIGTIYAAYNDESSTSTTPYYVVTEDNSVYLCVKQSRNNSGVPQPSTVKPTGVSNKTFVTGDGYAWKFLYSIGTLDATNYLSANYMPVKLVGKLDSDGAGGITSLAVDVEQKGIQDAAIKAPLTGVTVTNGGAGYTSSPTVTITGDGTGARALATISGGTVTKIELEESDGELVTGTGYTYAHITLTGGGSPTSVAKARASIGPKAGWGADPRVDLRARAVMFNIRPEGDETGEFVVGNSFRQIGVIRNPLQKDSDNANPFTADVGNTLRRLQLSTLTGLSFTKGGTLIGGTSGARAIIDDVDSDEIWYHQTETTGFTQFVENEGVTDSDGGSGTTELVGTDADNLAYHLPTVTPFRGEILYIDNRAKIDRTSTSTEDIKVIIEI